MGGTEVRADGDGGAQPNQAANSTSERTSRRWLGVLARLGLAGMVAGGAILAGGAAVIALQERAASAADPLPRAPLPVETVAVALQDTYEIAERFAGRLEPARASDLSFERAGRLDAIGVEEGDRVGAEDALAELDTDLLRARRQGLQAQRARAAAELELAERTRSRQGDLSSKGFASEQRFDEAETRAITLTAEIAAIDADIAGLDIEIAKSTLRAPFPGVIAERLADPGAMLGMGAPVARLLEVDRPQARIGVPPEQAARLEAGRPYPLEVGGRTVEGRLVALRPDLATGTRTVAALFDVIAPPQGPALRFGDIVRLSLSAEAPGRGAWLPLSALQESVEGLWSVYTLDLSDTVAPATADDGAAPLPAIARKTVEALHVAEGRVFVRGALVEGERVVVSGVNRISLGQRVAAD